MKKIFSIATVVILVACNNSKKESGTGDATTTTVTENNTSPVSSNSSAGAATVTYTVADTARSVSGSVLVQKDKDKLSPGNEHLAIVTGNSSGDESFVLNFLFALKPGTYPVAGMSFTLSNQVFGGILGGGPKITKYKVTLTECEDLGSNSMGGHKWKISGSVDEEVTIEAMGIMKMDKTHPSDIKVNKISFTNLTFDDNWEEMMNKAMEKMKEKK